MRAATKKELNLSAMLLTPAVFMGWLASKLYPDSVAFFLFAAAALLGIWGMVHCINLCATTVVGKANDTIFDFAGPSYIPNLSRPLNMYNLPEPTSENPRQEQDEQTDPQEQEIVVELTDDSASPGSAST